MWLLFVPETKNETEGKSTSILLDIQKASTEAILIISKENFQRSFLKLYDRCKQFISSDVFRMIINKNF